jgi:hypothetical protein
LTAVDVAGGISSDPEDVYHVLNHLAANGQAKVKRGATPAQDLFGK